MKKQLARLEWTDIEQECWQKQRQADGRLRTVGRPKKKKARHVQLICEEHDVSAADDVQIKRILKEYISKEEEI